ATGTGTVYDKAEAFAHDFIILVAGILTLAGSMKALDAGLSSFQSATQELFGRKSRLTSSEVTQTYKGTKLITSFEDFIEYIKGFLDDSKWIGRTERGVGINVFIRFCFKRTGRLGIC
ncbi:MAG: hypothetical protein K2J67_09195, partial [Lachnospiraceae bacterium]|nr:hypothetical protein [Lachnospiraceae bacterium]